VFALLSQDEKGAEIAINHNFKNEMTEIARLKNYLNILDGEVSLEELDDKKDSLTELDKTMLKAREIADENYYAAKAFLEEELDDSDAARSQLLNFYNQNGDYSSGMELLETWTKELENKEGDNTAKIDVLKNWMAQLEHAGERQGLGLEGMDTKKKILALEKHLQARPTDVAAHHQLKNLYLEQDDMVKAKEHNDIALELSQTLIEQSEFEQNSIGYFDYKTLHADYTATAAHIAFTEGDYETAERLAKNALEDDLTSLAAQNVLSNTLTKNNRVDEAIDSWKVFKQTQFEKVQSDEMLDNLYEFKASQLLNDGKFEEAVETAELIKRDSEIKTQLEEIKEKVAVEQKVVDLILDDKLDEARSVAEEEGISESKLSNGMTVDENIRVQKAMDLMGERKYEEAVKEIDGIEAVKDMKLMLEFSMEIKETAPEKLEELQKVLETKAYAASDEGMAMILEDPTADPKVIREEYADALKEYQGFYSQYVSMLSDDEFADELERQTDEKLVEMLIMTSDKEMLISEKERIETQLKSGSDDSLENKVIQIDAALDSQNMNTQNLVNYVRQLNIDNLELQSENSGMMSGIKNFFGAGNEEDAHKSQLKTSIYNQMLDSIVGTENDRELIQNLLKETEDQLNDADEHTEISNNIILRSLKIRETESELIDKVPGIQKSGVSRNAAELLVDGERMRKLQSGLDELDTYGKSAKQAEIKSLEQDLTRNLAVLQRNKYDDAEVELELLIIGAQSGAALVSINRFSEMETYMDNVEQGSENFMQGSIISAYRLLQPKYWTGYDESLDRVDETIRDKRIIENSIGYIQDYDLDLERIKSNTNPYTSEEVHAILAERNVEHAETRADVIAKTLQKAGEEDLLVLDNNPIFRTREDLYSDSELYEMDMLDQAVKPMDLGFIVLSAGVAGLVAKGTTAFITGGKATSKLATAGLLVTETAIEGAVFTASHNVLDMARGHEVDWKNYPTDALHSTVAFGALKGTQGVFSKTLSKIRMNTH